ncbi:hypothetical protein KSS87_002301, partial [Heliosperma pusillum]
MSCFRLETSLTCVFLMTKGNFGGTFGGKFSEYDWKELFEDNIGWQVGPLSDLSVWNSKWVDGDYPLPAHPSLLYGSPSISGLKIRNLIDPGLGWNTDMIYAFFSPLSAIKILAIPLTQSTKEDSIFWNLSTHGGYTVKSGYFKIISSIWQESATAKDKSRVSLDSSNFFKKLLWRLPGAKSWIILIWKILTGSMAVGSEFERRGIGIYGFCRLCNDQIMESSAHLFRDCPFARRMWAGSNLGIKTDLDGELDIREWIINWIRFLSKSEEKDFKILSFLSTIWSIWITRNNAVFRDLWGMDNAIFFYENIFAAALSSCANKKELSNVKRSLCYITVLEEEKITRGVVFNLIGSSSECQMDRLFVDAAWNTSLASGFGWVLKRFAGPQISNFRGHVFSQSSEQAEIKAIMEGMRWAVSNGFFHSLTTMAEEAILGYLEKNDQIPDSGCFAAEFGLDHDEIVNVVKSLHAYELVVAQDIKRESWILTDEGKSYAVAGSPEMQFFLAIPTDGIAPDELQKKLDPAVYKIGSSQAMKNKWVERGKQLISRKIVFLLQVQNVEDEVKQLLVRIQAGEVIGQEEINALKKRKLIAPQTWKEYSLTKGVKYAPKRMKAATDLTRENMQRWLRYKTMSSKRCREPLLPLQGYPSLQLQHRKRTSLRRHGKSQKLIVADKQTTCIDRKWEDMDHEILILIMKKYKWYQLGRFDFVICKTWLSAFLDVLFPPGDVLDLRLLDDQGNFGGTFGVKFLEFDWKVRKFFHYLKLNLDRRSPNHYTKLVLCEGILHHKAYSDLAQRLPLLKSFVSPVMISSCGPRLRPEPYVDSYHVVSLAMFRHWNNLEEVHCHYSMLWDLSSFCKSVRNLTLVGRPGYRQLLMDGMVLAIAKNFPHLDRLSMSAFVFSFT